MSSRQHINLYPRKIDGTEMICAKFAFSRRLFEEFKFKTNFKWSQKENFWYLPRAQFKLSIFFDRFRNLAYIDYSSISKSVKSSASANNCPSSKSRFYEEIDVKTMEEIESFIHWMRQHRYAKNTIKIYRNQLLVFFRFYPKLSPKNVNTSHIEAFNHRYILANEFSVAYQNQTINALKKFFYKMYGEEHDLKSLERPRKQRALPKIIPLEQVKAMLNSISNLKHKTALSCIYSLGLRRSELIALKLSDLDFLRNQVMIKNSKGNKDRVLPLPRNLKRLIRSHIEANDPEIWLIEGYKKGNPYSATSLQNIFKKYLNKVMKGHTFTLHCLRHSIATHLLEAGTDIRYIQELLGHKSTRTTEIYTHVSIKSLHRIKNPFEDFDI